jgi:hypothetical protein
LQQSFFKKKTSYAGVIFSIALLILLAAEFCSFAIGAYFVYDAPVSNVVAITTTNSSGASLSVNATGLQNSTIRTIWVDPSITLGQNQTPYVQSGSGFILGNVTTSSSGNISKNFQIDSSTLSKIESDGQTVHTVWIIGVQSSQLASSGNLNELTNDSEQNYTASAQGSGIILFATLITFVLPINFSLGQLFLVLWTIYLILFAVAMNGPIRNMFSAIKRSTTEGLTSLFDNSMLATLIVFPVVVWVTVAISLLEAAGGVSTGSLPPADPLLEFVELTLAPLREEIGFRVIPIGIVALLILFSRGKLRDGLLALWHPARYLKKNDSPEAYSRHVKYIYVAMAISAVLFGLAHVLLGAGWGPGKILSAAVAGVGLAGLYYLYGFAATVLLHWSIDYFLAFFDLNSSFQTAGEWVTLYTLALAVAGSIVLLLVGLRTFRNRKLGLSPDNWFGRG